MTAPAAADIRRVERPPRAWTQPQIPVDLVLGRQRLGRQPVVLQFSRVPGRGVCPGGVNLAQPPAAGHLDAEHEVGFAESLRAGLIDPAVLPGGVHHRLPLRDGHARGLLAVDVLAGAHGHDRGRRVPSIAGRDDQSVNVGALGKKLTHVAVDGTIVASVVGVDEFLDRLPPRLLGITHGDEADILLGQHPLDDVRSAPADADTAEHDLLARRNRTVPAQHRGRHDIRRCKRPAGKSRVLQHLSPAEHGLSGPGRKSA